MFCTRCGRDVPDGAAQCAACGARIAARPPAGYAQQWTGPAFRLDPHRLTSGDRITGISTLLLLISLFLPWYG